MGRDMLGDVEEVQQAISWNRFALLCALLLYMLQQVGLLYHIGIYSLSLLAVGIADVVVLLLLLSSRSSEYAAVEGGTCWVIYSWSLAVKYILFFFIIFEGAGPHTGVVFRGLLGGVLEVGLLLSLSAGVYALLTFRASEALFGGISHFTLGSMLHTDATTHVVLDLIDGVAAFHSFAVIPDAIQQQNRWLRILVGIIVPLSVFLHGYSFPSAGGGPSGAGVAGVGGGGAHVGRKGGAGGAYELGDMQMTRKHAAIVGIFFVDLPLLALRLFSWAYYPVYEGLSPFMFKNVCFIPIQLARLRQAAAAARLQRRWYGEGGGLGGPSVGGSLGAPSNDGRFGSPGGAPFLSGGGGPRLPPAAAAAVALEALAAEQLTMGGQGEETGKATPSRRARWSNKSLRRQAPKRASQASSYSPIHELHAPEGPPGVDRSHQKQQQQHWHKLRTSFDGLKGLAFWRRTQQKGKETDADAANSGLTDYQASLARLVAVCQAAAAAPRRVPAPGFSMRRILQRLVYSLRQLGSRHSAATLLSSSFPSSFFQSVRLGFPFMVTWICQLAIVSTLFFFYDDFSVFPIKLYSLPLLHSEGFSWSSLESETRICLCIVGSHCLLLFSLYFLASPLLDCLFSCLFTSIRLASFYLAVLAFRDFGVFADFLQLASTHRFTEIGKYCLFLFAVEPLFSILLSLYPFISVLLGRETLTYVVASPLSSNKAKFSDTQARPEMDFARVDEHPRGDEQETVSTASLMLFISCRAMTAPVSLHQLLVGPNLIKAVRLNDGLLRAHWRSLLTSLVVRVWCCCLFFSFPASVGHRPATMPGMESLLGVQWFAVCSLASLIFAAHLLLTFVYLVFAQITRLLAIKRMENKAIFRDLAEIAFRLKEERLSASLGHSPLPGKETVNLSKEAREVVARYERQCFFTYPGELLPPFF